MYQNKRQPCEVENHRFDYKSADDDRTTTLATLYFSNFDDVVLWLDPLRPIFSHEHGRCVITGHPLAAAVEALDLESSLLPKKYANWLPQMLKAWAEQHPKAHWVCG